MRRIALPLFVGLTLFAAGPAEALDLRVTLRGSRASMERQNEFAKSSELRFARTRGDLESAVSGGHLAHVPGNDDYRVIAAYPYAVAEMRVFLERLGAQYHAACGEQLVVTSLARPQDRQPSNASPLSVHPAGMAVDLRVSARKSCQNWLRQALLGLEAKGVLDGTEEFRPPHFHVALFPGPYMAYVDELIADSLAANPSHAAEVDPAAGPQSGASIAVQDESAADAAAEAPRRSWLSRWFSGIASLLRRD